MKKPNHGKGKVGPGGIRCACCTKGKPKITKKLTNRYFRKLAKKNLTSLISRVY